MIAHRCPWRHRRGTRLVGLFALGFAASCGARTSLDQTSIAEPDYPAALAHASCDGIDRCCKLAGYGAARSNCFPQTRSATASLAAAARQRGAHYDGVAAARCVAQTRRGMDQCLSYKQLDLGGCVDVYSGGDLPTGAKCTTSGECIAGDVCNASAPGPYRCEPYSVAGEGEPCGISAHAVVDCAPNLFCNGTCQSWLPLGTPCPDGAQGDLCAPGAVCDFHGSKTCVAARPVGSACTDPTQCEGYACYSGRCRLVPGFVASKSCSP